MIDFKKATEDLKKWKASGRWIWFFHEGSDSVFIDSRIPEDELVEEVGRMYEPTWEDFKRAYKKAGWREENLKYLHKTVQKAIDDFKAKSLKKKQGKAWMKSDTHRMFDMYFAGMHPKSIADSLGFTQADVQRRIGIYAFNSNNKAVTYKPKRRLSRKGKPFTENELRFIDSHLHCKPAEGTIAEHEGWHKKITPEVTAKILQRDVSEIATDDEALERHRDMKSYFNIPGLGVDLCLAHRCLRHFLLKPIISDKALKELEAEEIEFGKHADVLRLPPAKTVYDIPQRIRSLALYLSCRDQEEKTKKEIF